ncbi:MAG: AgmX/PglI C-terminal domain-containing protein, partial [Myxococcota bacterium]|nr:AgmX/PglI C-terminal domain-containing protein [Myxococcota bacterium]
QGERSDGGKVTLSFMISKSRSHGRVKARPLVVENTFRGEAGRRLGECVAQEVQRWRFPAPRNGDAEMTYPFILVP